MPGQKLVLDKLFLNELMKESWEPDLEASFRAG